MNIEQYLNETFTYDPITGNLFWREDRPKEHFKRNNEYQSFLNHRAGKQVAPSINAYGYPVIGVKKKVMAVHLVAFVLIHGVFPSKNIDHIDGNPKNNKWDNLREVTQAINTRNQCMNSRNTSGYAGVYWARRERRWASQVKVDGITKRLGVFDSPEEAYQARLNFLSLRPDLGYTERHGLPH